MLIVQKWINAIENLGLPFPLNFDFTFFYKGISVALEIDHALSAPTSLFMLYKTLHFLPLDARNHILQEILKKYFYKLFFSWSFNIRDIFIALFLYQIEYSYIQKNILNYGIWEKPETIPPVKKVEKTADQLYFSWMYNLRQIEGSVDLFTEKQGGTNNFAT